MLLSISDIIDLPSQVLQIACENTAKNVIDHFLKEYPSVTEIYNCSISGHRQTIKRAVISLGLNPQEIGNLNQFLDEYLLDMEKDCNIKHNFGICSQKALRTIFLQKTHIIIELVNSVISQSMAGNTSFNFIVKLHSIPQKLISQGTIYWLRGIVCFTPPQSPHGIKDIGHYKAICLRPDEKWELYDDLKDSKIDISNQRQFNCEMLVYTI